MSAVGISWEDWHDALKRFWKPKPDAQMQLVTILPPGVDAREFLQEFVLARQLINSPFGQNGDNMESEYLLQFFGYAHLPPAMQEISRPFGELATKLVAVLPRNPERTVALRKLLEAKDCAVRANIFKSQPQQPSVGGL